MQKGLYLNQNVKQKKIEKSNYKIMAFASMSTEKGNVQRTKYLTPLTKAKKYYNFKGYPHVSMVLEFLRLVSILRNRSVV